MRIAVAGFSYETLTFCPEALDTEGEGQGYIAAKYGVDAPR